VAPAPISGPGTVSAGLGEAVPGPDGAAMGRRFLNVRLDPELIHAEVLVTQVSEATLWQRAHSELWIGLLTTGWVHERDHDVVAGDVIIWEGEDPVRIELSPAPSDVGTARGSELVLVRLSRRDGRSLRWVP